MLMEQARIDITEFGKKMSSSGLSKGTSGNLSVYDPETGYMAISPSGVGYFDTVPADIVIMTLDGKVVEGDRNPSSEHDLHAAFYRNKPDARGVVHTHSPFCSAFACLNLPLRAVHYVVSTCGASSVPCAAYATFGTPELAENAIHACGEGKAVLLANHGLVTCGPSLAKAFSIAVNMEFNAEMQWRCMSVGEPVILSDEEIGRVMERSKTYGQPAKPQENKDGSLY